MKERDRSKKMIIKSKRERKTERQRKGETWLDR